ncbi:uncharacterized protein LOC142587357 [Dermacentor variabilis]|uniref:uncharacterized protein LOC142587357 n=1 Tax=Dermacentor variabilis TaxID=34621 RepID=UPI003F5C4457
MEICGNQCNARQSSAVLTLSVTKRARLPAIPPMCQPCFCRVTEEVMQYYRHQSSTDIRAVFYRVQRRRAVLQAPTSKSAITATANSFENSSTDFADEIIASPEETGTSASVMTQTDADFNGGVCTLFLSVTAEGAASTQVCHTNIVEKGVQASASVRSTALGPNERSCAFLGYNYLIQKKDAFRELCGVSANVFPCSCLCFHPLL